MKNLIVVLILALFFLLDGVVGGAETMPETTPVDTVEESGFKDALGAYLKTQDSDIKDTPYEMEIADLNGDGVKDALVLLSGPYWCGSGGCTLLVFQGEKDGKAKFVSDTSLVRGPITISDEKSSGWSDLVFMLSGGGAKAGDVALKFDGKGYPSNGSDAPYLKPGQEVSGKKVFTNW